MEAKDTSVFDVCGTLYYSNTTTDFLQFYFEKESSHKLALLNQISQKRSFIFLYRAIMFKIFHRDLFKRARVLLLKGERREIVEEAAIRFFDDFLVEKEIKEVHLLLEKKLRESVPILISNSIEPVIKAISINKGIDFCATSLKTINGFYTGEIDMDLMGKKHILVDNLIGKSLTVVTDNKSDFKLVELANERHVVLHNKSSMKFWNRLKPNYIFA